MIVEFYLVVSKNGAVRTVKSRPNLSWDEIAIKQNLELPNAIFQRPMLEATVKIPNEAALPEAIPADVVENVKEAIEQAAGIEVRLRVVNSED